MPLVSLGVAGDVQVTHGVAGGVSGGLLDVGVVETLLESQVKPLFAVSKERNVLSSPRCCRTVCQG